MKSDDEMTVDDRKHSTFQLDAWKGSFGDDYLDRNDVDSSNVDKGSEVFQRILSERAITSVLEVGSNIGLKLHYINEVFSGKAKLFALEPNVKAYEKLVEQRGFHLEKAWNCDVFNIPLPDQSVDLIFTSGVLIHIASDDLGRATDEIVRVANKYILCLEYFSSSPVEVPYRGHNSLLFKRDFGSYYLDRFPQLTCLDYGFLWKREVQVFDNLNWWLFHV